MPNISFHTSGPERDFCRRGAQVPIDGAAMKERGILYSAPMVLAKLAGRKTHTRRIVKPQPHGLSRDGAIIPATHAYPWSDPPWWDFVLGDGPAVRRIKAPCVAGMRLWGREAWKTTVLYDAKPPRDVPQGEAVQYLADGRFNDAKGIRMFGRYRHARFMVRWMARILDEVVSVRVERLLDITEADARAEGIEPVINVPPYRDGWRWPGGEELFPNATTAYLAGWDTINGKGSAASNPWVWRIETRPVTP